MWNDGPAEATRSASGSCGSLIEVAVPAPEPRTKLHKQLTGIYQRAGKE